MRRLPWLVLALALLPSPALAREPKCPLPMDSCLVEFGRMRENPWLGIGVTRDSLGRRVVSTVTPHAPAEQAGIRAGDVLETIDGVAPPVFFAGRAGWKTGQGIPVGVLRAGHPRTLTLKAQRIPDDLFARMVGEHMLESHLAYMAPGGDH